MNQTRPLTTTLLVLALALIIASGATWVGTDLVDRSPSDETAELQLLSVTSTPDMNLEVFFTSFSLVVLSFLVIILIRLNRQIPNRLTLTLVLFASAVIVSVLLANPLTWSLLGLSAEEVSSLSYLSDAFIAIAVSILLYQTAI